MKKTFYDSRRSKITELRSHSLATKTSGLVCTEELKHFLHLRILEGAKYKVFIRTSARTDYSQQLPLKIMDSLEV